MSEIYNEGEKDDIIEDPELSDLKEGDEGYDKIDWKALAEKNAGIAKRAKTKLQKMKSSKGDEGKGGDGKGSDGKKGDEPKGLDRIDRTVLRAEKITDPDEVKLVEDIMKETGKDVESVLASKYFQSELKALREERSADDATPSGSKRTGQAGKDSVDYWLAKGELPPTDQPELRRKVVNAKIAKEKSKSEFSNNPIQ